MKTFEKIKERGITLIALVITIIVLLILARSYNCGTIRREWNFNKSSRFKTKNRNCRNKRGYSKENIRRTSIK